ncbi:MAG: thiamine diphosphokinase, partial [Chloroflexi bacterium]|nr:thiamine diphosphokinase [Chloroflexota bacterium]
MAQELHIVVAANGDANHPDRLAALLDEANVLIAADGGANWLFALGRQPDVVVGDMDSILPETLEALIRAGCRVRRHPSQKDETDTELALLEAAAMGATRITLLGALGGRVDHQIANLMLLAMPQLAGIETVIYDGRSR